jgi:nicotinate-nucleotide--dimethylbenzimidazole phosphoribosyltransferase
MLDINLCSVKPISRALDDALHHAINNKTKPLGSLGQLEHLALRIGRIQQSTTPKLQKPHICVFAGDHGIASEGVSAYPSEVTPQMVLNFLNGGAGINVLARQNNIALTIVDAGVNAEFGEHPMLINAKIRRGTRNFLHEPAMTLDECRTALANGGQIVQSIHTEGSTVIGFGEMGIGNTTSAAALMHIFTKEPLETCVGRGTGLNDAQLTHKRNVLAQAMTTHNSTLHNASKQPLDVLATFGGYEIAMMCGAMLEAAALGMIVLVDGFIATSALLAAHALCPAILDYCIFSHESDEHGHAAMLRFLGATPLLRLSLRLGEGTGSALAYPIVQASVSFLNEMATFESAGVSDKR